MVLSIDQYKKIAGDTHPDRSEEQKQSWAESKVNSSKTEEEKKSWWILNQLWDWWHKAWTSISWWFDDIISDETADNSWIAKVWDMALNVVWWVLWWAVESIAQTPRFLTDLVSMPFTEKSEWWWSDVKARANELQDDYWMNRVWSWLTAIDENNDSEHTSAQTVFQLLNNPLLLKWAWKVLDSIWVWIKWFWKVDDVARVVWKVDNVADDAAKVAKWTKLVEWAKAWTEIVEDVAKTWGKTNIITKIKNTANKTKNYWENTSIWTKLKDATVSTTRFIWWPITDAYDIIKTWVNTTRWALKITGVWTAVMKWVAATIWEIVQTAGKFISKPLSYRTPRLWTTATADMLIWDPIQAWMSASDKREFRETYWYNIDTAQYLNDKQLDEYYDQNNIAQDKRLTAEQIAQKRSELWENFLSNYTETAKNVFEMFDIFSAPTYMIQQRTNPELDIIRNQRWEFRWFSDWKSVNFDTGEIKDQDWNILNREDLSAEELMEIGNVYQSTYWSTTQDDATEDNIKWSKQTWIQANNITNTINNWIVNWMLESSSENQLIASENEWVRANAVYISNQLNEASKEYANAIVSNYTVDEINSSTQLQQEIRNWLDAYSRLFNTAAEIIAWLDRDEYNDVTRFKKVLTAAYNSLDDNTKNIIDSNLYKRSIDYNNWLETGFDEWYMKAATWTKRVTDKMLNIFWSEDTNTWFEQWLSWIAWSIINPELAWWWTAWWEISVWLRDNAAYAVDMVVLNKINDAYIEKFTSNQLSNIIRKNPKLNTKVFNSIKWWLTEMSSEFLENFTDAISMVEDPNHDYDYFTGLLFGMFQGAMAGYASSTDSYSSFKDFLTRPENRDMVLENMWIYVNAIEDPQVKASFLSIVSQLMDDKSENNLIDIMSNVASQTNNWIEWLMQWYALYQTNKMIWDHINNVVWQVLDQINAVEEWTPEAIQTYFSTSSDPTWQTNFNNFQLGRQFVFNQSIIDSVRNSEVNRTEVQRIARTATALIKSSFDVAWMSLEQWINYMAPKINTNWDKIITPIKETKTVEKEVANWMTWNPIKDVVHVYTKTNEIAFTIWDNLWITKDNNLVFWPRKSKFWFKLKDWFKNRIKITTTAENWTETTQEYSMKEYIQKQINDSGLTIEQKQFIGTILFKTTVSWLNPYFNDDWSLTRLWEDFLQQVMPELEERSSNKAFFENIQRIQIFKEAAAQKSKLDAMKESWANMQTHMWIRINWQTFVDGADLNNIPDETELPMQINWQPVKKWDLKKWILVNDNWRLATYQINEAWILNITYDEAEEAEQPTDAEQPAETETPQQTQAQDEVQQRLNEVAVMLPWWSVEVTKQNTDPITQETSIPVSVYEHEHQNLEWKFLPPQELLWHRDTFKPYIPYIAKSKQTVEFQISNEFWDFAYPDYLKRISHYSINNNPTTQAQLPKVTITQKDWAQKVYSLVFIWEWEITDRAWITDIRQRRHNYFRSFALVDLNEETIEFWTTNTIRPRAELNDYIKTHPGAWYYQNNKTVIIKKKDWSPMEWNRIISFTRAKDKIDWQRSWNQWYISTTIQLERMSREDINMAFENKRVFMNAPANGSKAKWIIFNFETNQFENIEYDPRPVFTTSDVVFNDNNQKLTIWWIDIPLQHRSYENWIPLRWDKFEWDTETMWNWFKMLWDKWQTIWEGWEVEDIPDAKKISEVKKEFVKSIDAQNDNVNMVIEQAENTPVEATESVEETIVKEQNANAIILLSEWELQSEWTLDKSIIPFDWIIYEQETKDIVEFFNQFSNTESKEFNGDLLKQILKLKNWQWIKISKKNNVYLRKNKYWFFVFTRWYQQISPFTNWWDWRALVEMASNHDIGLWQWIRRVFEIVLDEDIWVSDESWFVDKYSSSWNEMLEMNDQDYDSIMNYTHGSISWWIDLAIWDHRDINYTKTLRLVHVDGGYYIAKRDQESFLYLPVTDVYNNIHDLESDLFIVNNLDEESIPAPEDLLASEYTPNQTIAESLLTDQSTIKQLADDCEELWIVLWALDHETLWHLYYAYASWQWIDYVIEQFASQIPSSYVDNKIVDLLINKWVLQRWWKYWWLTLSQIIAYNYGLKKIKKWNINVIARNVRQAMWTLSDDQEQDLISTIADYYIQNYLNLNPTRYWDDNVFRSRIEEIVRRKLLESDIFVHEEWTNNALLSEENVDLALQLERLNKNDLKIFAKAAFDKGLITRSSYNYLMESNPFLAVVWQEGWSYEVWPFWSAMLESINKIPELAEITYWDANKAKLQLLFDVYSYFAWSRKASYAWVVEFLKKKYTNIWQREPMAQMIRILENDSKKVWVLYHTDWVMMSLRSSQLDSYENDPYQIFVNSKTNNQSIEDALIILESTDSDSFQQIIQYAPKEIKDSIYNKFAEDNEKEKSSNIAYRLVSWILDNNLKILSDLKSESQKDLPNVEWDIKDILKWFNRMSLVNSTITQALYQRFWIYWLDLNKWTVILTNNRQNSLWKWMQNFENVERFPLLSISELDELELDVNVIVPYWVSIPESKKWYKHNIIKMNNAWYQDWALVVNRRWNSISDFENRMYNILWVYWLQVRNVEWFKLTKEQKDLIKESKNQKSLYWNIFKNNILPNLSPENRNINQEQFEEAITATWMRRVWLLKLYKCFAAWDLQEMVDNSIAVINEATQSAFALKSNSESWKNSVNTTKAISDFVEYISTKINSNSWKERVSEAFWDFLLAQLQVWKIDINDWYNSFRNTHNQAIKELYDLPEFKQASVQWLELDELFMNYDNTTISPTKQEKALLLQDSKIADTSEIDERIAIARKNLNELKKSTSPDQNRINTLSSYIESLIEERNWLIIRNTEFSETAYADGNFMEIINENAWALLQQDETYAENSEVLSTAAEDQNKQFQDKVMKVLEVMYNNFIKDNAITVDAQDRTNDNTNIVSEWLLWLLTWEWVFANAYWDVTVWSERKSRYDFSNRNLYQVISILSTLKITNPKKFQDLLDNIFKTYKDIWYTYDTATHQKLLAYKDQVAKNPAALYKIFWEITNDKNYSVWFLWWWQIEKKLNYEDVNVNWLLQAASNAYIESSPYLNGGDNMNEKIEEYHNLYDHYFDGLLPEWVKPSAEQVKAFAKLRDAFDNRKTKWENTDKNKVFTIPGIAWTWKTTLLTAFFNYVSEQGWAQSELDNVANWKQTSIIYNFNYPDSEVLWSLKQKWWKWYAKLIDKSWKGWEIYIEFEWWDNLINHRDLINKNANEILEWYNWLRDNDKENAATILAEKWTEDRWNFSKTSWKIKKFKIVSASDVKWNAIEIKTNPNWELSPRKDTTIKNIPIIKSIWDLHFAVRMHQTVSSLKATFSEWNSFRWIDYATEWSYMEQDDPALMRLTWYWETPIIKWKYQMEWQFIIIDEAQNSYNSNLKAITEQLWWNNVVVMLWDFHQNSKWDFFENLSKDEQYMVETHRWTPDINAINEINAFTQEALIKANAIWFYMTDSDDFRRYDIVNKDWYNAKPNEYLMVVKTNQTRKSENDKYISNLWWMNKIISDWKTLQVMVVDVKSNKEKNRKWRKSEMLKEWLNMEWFKKASKWDFYYKEKKWKFQVFFPSTDTTNANDSYIESFDSLFQTQVNKWKDVEIFAPAFAITTEKESWKTVDNIILHQEITDTDYDHLSDNNAKQYYDAFTRWAKKVYLPMKTPRLIWITRDDVEALRKWEQLKRWYVERPEDKTTIEEFTLPVITMARDWWMDKLDDIDFLLSHIWWQWRKKLQPLFRAVYALKSYNLWDQTFADVEQYWSTESNEYANILKKNIADRWDLYKNTVIKYLQWQTIEWVSDIIDRIDWTIYWQTYRVPKYKKVQKNQYIDWRYWEPDLIIWQNTKYRNKTITLNDLNNQVDQVAEWSLTNWQVYYPDFSMENWKYVMKLKPIDADRVTKSTQWWIEYTQAWERNSINFTQEQRNVDRIFAKRIWDLQFFDQQWITSDNVISVEDTFWNDLKDTVDRFYSRLSDDDLYREDQYYEWEYIDNPIQTFYESISWRINNRDASDLEQLQADIKEFIERADAIDNREITSWMDIQENQTQIFINESGLLSDMEAEENCEG